MKKPASFETGFSLSPKAKLPDGDIFFVTVRKKWKPQLNTSQKADLPSAAALRRRPRRRKIK
jgi:hypothetical protein